MEEGSFRCDANISVRRKGDAKLGTRVEVKNLNSIRNVKRAIDYEAQRLIGLIESGEPILQQTRSFDANNGTTFAIRDKEDADDYRYFPDPDLAPFYLDDEFVEAIRLSIPILQEERVQKYASEWQLSEYDANVLTDEKEMADYFEQVIKFTSNYKAAANWMLGPIKSWLNEHNKSIRDFPLKPEKIASTLALVDAGKLSFTIASGRLFSLLISDPLKDPDEIAVEHNLIQQSEVNSLEPIIDEILHKHAEKVKEYKKGKKGCCRCSLVK
jgi:aspartyl-tRNA(Asn)/glutamyl-tRNA(Gln) amidotransferase subunit B